MARTRQFFIDADYFVWIQEIQVLCSSGNHNIPVKFRPNTVVLFTLYIGRCCQLALYMGRSMNSSIRPNSICPRTRIGIIPRNWTDSKSGVRWSVFQFDCLE